MFLLVTRVSILGMIKLAACFSRCDCAGEHAKSVLSIRFLFTCMEKKTMTKVR